MARGQQYEETRSARAYPPLARSLCDPSRPNIRWQWFFREPLLMDTEGLLGLCGGKAGRRPSPWAAPLARAIAHGAAGITGFGLRCQTRREGIWGEVGGLGSLEFRGSWGFVGSHVFGVSDVFLELGGCNVG